MMLEVELLQLFDNRLWILPRASGSDVGSSEDGAKGSGSMVDRPFLSMILSAADPEPASSSLSELSAKVKMVLPIHRLIIGLFAWANCLLGCLDLHLRTHQ